MLDPTGATPSAPIPGCLLWRGLEHLDVTVDISLDLDLSDLILCVLLDQRLLLNGGHVFEHLLSLSRGKG